MGIKSRRLTNSTTTPMRIDSAISGASVQFTTLDAIWLGHKTSFAKNDGSCRFLAAGVPVQFEDVEDVTSTQGLYFVPDGSSASVDVTEWNLNW